MSATTTGTPAEPTPEPTPEPGPGLGPPVPPGLLRDWVVCGLVAATARFVPLPLLDDALARRAVREAVRRTLRVHGRTYPVEAVQPLHDRPGSLLGAVAALPVRLALWPWRKWVRLAGAVQGVPSDLVRVLALGRTTHRVLLRGGLTDDPTRGRGPASRRALRQEAEHVRAALDETLAELDLHLLRGALQDAVGGARGLSGALVDYARGRFDAQRGDDDLAPGTTVDEGVDRVLAALRQPEVRRVVAELDRRVDARLGLG
jgi:hypothetical protein